MREPPDLSDGEIPSAKPGGLAFRRRAVWLLVDTLLVVAFVTTWFYTGGMICACGDFFQPALMFTWALLRASWSMEKPEVPEVAKTPGGQRQWLRSTRVLFRFVAVWALVGLLPLLVFEANLPPARKNGLATPLEVVAAVGLLLLWFAGIPFGLLLIERSSRAKPLEAVDDRLLE